MGGMGGVGLDRLRSRVKPRPQIMLTLMRNSCSFFGTIGKRVQTNRRVAPISSCKLRQTPGIRQ